MADNFLETHRAEYEKRKARWLKKKKYSFAKIRLSSDKPEDESL
ncbi:dehydrogenase [Prevotella sp. oral taxon 820]|nr:MULTISPECIES: dehydrogenase [Prevotella]PTL25125.1 dehydrogenase [Prevotella sp. oral taxon 820]